MATLAFAQTTHTPPTPAQIAQRRVQMLTNMLGLSSGQQTQATGYFLTAATANATVETNLKTERQSLDTAITTGNTGSIPQIAMTIGNLEGSLAANNALADAQLYAILTTTQQATFAKTLNRGFGPMGGGRGFGHGGPQ